MTPPPPYNELDVKLPIVMLPVRIETRYFEINSDLVELRVRIFPSQAHVTSARPGVDPAERDETMAYWRTRKTAGDTAAATDAAWQRMVQMFGDSRAQYLRRILAPTVDANGGLVFPNVPVNPPPETAGVLAAEATALPSRFFVAGYAGAARQFLAPGLKLPAMVNAGPHGDPASTRWQSDFASAESIGLAVRIQLTRPAAQSLTRLLVYGVREGADAAGSQAAIEQLFERHSRESGIALLATGTPTNNTPTARVPVPAEAKGVTPSAGSDAGRLATALGMKAAAFVSASGTAASTEPLVQAMHTALWPATLGYFCESLMWPAITDQMTARGKTLFQKFVRPRGPYPVLAFGGQPYGVLPVSSVRQWRNAQGVPEGLPAALGSMQLEWLAASAFTPRLGQSADPGADLNAALSLSPVSTRWVARTLQPSWAVTFTIPPWSPDFPLPFPDPFLIQGFATQWRLTTETAPLGIQGFPYMSNFLFNDSTFRANVELVGAPDVSRTGPLPANANYINSIATADIEPLKTHNLPGSSPRTMLYLLLRHAMLLGMRRIASRFFGTVSGDIVEDGYTSDPARIVWNRLNTPVPALQNKTLAAVFKGTLPATPEFADFVQQRNALKTLANVPVGEVERLTAEAMDACSYRLDAWITALASERLAAMRTAKPLGSHLGAYGWVSAPPIPSVLSKDGAAPFLDPDSEGYIHAPHLDHARTAAVLRAGFIARHQEGAQAPLAVDLFSDRVRDARGLVEAVRNGASLAALLGERIERWMADAGLGTELANVRGQFSLIDGSGRQRIDGLKAAQAWGSSAPPNLTPISARLAAALDALGDLLLAEAVHQQTTGNPSRAQSVLAALETGATLPSEFHVARTSADETARTWRVVLPVASEAVTTWIAGMIGDPAALAATVTRAGKPPAVLTLSQIGVTAPGLLEYVKAGAEASALSNLFAAKAGGGTVSYSPALRTALQAADALSRLVRGSKPLKNSDVGAGRTPLPGFDRNSAKKEWLHDLARVRPAVDALDSLDFILRGAGKDLRLRFLAADTDQNIVSIGDLPVGPVKGLLVDGWSEATPAVTATTGIAMHYDAPRSRAPQAILVMTPPDPRAWSQEGVEAALVETADITQSRMVRPNDVYGSFLPALYFADNTAGETVATDWISLGAVAQVMNP